MGEWITTDNISDEAWRRVLEYTNLDFSFSAISALHGEPVSKNMRQNYKKQSKQIRVAILQSKEYFDAAETTSLFTSPNHLYYGMVSLTSAIMLLLGTGDKALDRLRQNPSNRHHGLGFNTNVSNKTCQDGLAILENTYVKVLEKGFFLNWYETLPSRSDIYGTVQIREEKTTTSTRDTLGYETYLTCDQIVGWRINLLNLFERLPDIYPSLKRFGHSVIASRSTFEALTIKADKTYIHEWCIHGASSPSALEKILEKFKSPSRHISCWSCTDYENKNACIVKFTAKSREVKFQYPSIRENMNNYQILYELELDTPEIVDSYMAAYALSMLSRYYPDYWISCLESHCMAAKAIEHFMFVMKKKFPILALQLLVAHDLVISTHKPPWHV